MPSNVPAATGAASGAAAGSTATSVAAANAATAGSTSLFGRAFSGQATPQDTAKLLQLSQLLTGIAGGAGAAAQRGAGFGTGLAQGFATGGNALQQSIAQQQRQSLLKLQEQQLAQQIQKRKATTSALLNAKKKADGTIDFNALVTDIAKRGGDPSLVIDSLKARDQREFVRSLTEFRQKEATRRTGATIAAADRRAERTLRGQKDIAGIRAKAQATAAENRKRNQESARVRTAFFAEMGLKGPLGAIRLGRGQGRSAQRIISKARKLVESGAASTAEEAFEQVRNTKEGAKLFADFNAATTLGTKTPGGTDFKIIK